MYAIALSLFFISTVVMATEEDWEPPLVPSPVPFTVNSYDAIDAVRLIWRVGLLQYRYADGSTRIVPVESVRSYWAGFDPQAYENHQNRYDLLLNGEPIDWGNLFLLYNGEMINLQLLYTYRNQRPVPEVRYRNPAGR